MALDGPISINSNSEDEAVETAPPTVESSMPEQEKSLGIDANGNFFPGTVQPTDVESVLKDPNSSNDQKMQAIQLQTQFEQQDQEQKKLQDAQDLNNYNTWKSKVEEVSKYNAAAAVKGYAPMKVPSPDEFGLSVTKIDELSDPSKQKAVEPQAQQLEEQEELARVAKEQEKALKTQEAQNMGTQKAVMDIETQKQSKYDEAIQLVNEQDSQMDAIDPNRFWNSKSTFEKILGTIAIGMGAAGAGNGPNKAYEIIKDAINRDMDAQKITGDQKLAKQANALKRVGLEIEKFEAMSKDQERKANLQVAAQKLAQEREGILSTLANKKAIASAVTSGDGLSPEEAELVLTDQSMVDRKVVLPNGRIKLALNKASADKFNTENVEYKKSLNLTRSLKELAGELSLGDKLTPARFNSLKTESKQVAQALVGQLRLPMTGPGILTDHEREILIQDVIGDPTTVWKRPQVIKDQVASLERILQTLQGSNYEAAGIELKPTPNQVALKNLLKKGINSGVSPKYIEEQAKKMGIKIQ